MNYFKILNTIDKYNKTLFDVSIIEQQNFLAHFPEPKNDLERSYFQYKCQMLFSPKWLRILQNLIAFIFYPFVVLLLLLKSTPNSEEEVDTTIAINGIHRSLIPKEIIGKEINMAEGSSLKFCDLLFCIDVVCRYFYAPYFNLKLLLKVAQYRFIIEKYHPKQIALYTEFSFCSSVMTAYCNNLNIRHINYMHGEKLFYIRDSFFRFDKCYVWDEYYISLFRKLRAEQNQFVISKPDSLIFEASKFMNTNSEADYKYYLAAQSPDELRQIVDIMKAIQKNGHRVMLRPHPRYTDMSLLATLVDQNIIENGRDISIEESISNAANVISGYSTVLQQAYYAKKNIIIDDVVYQNQYQKLQELGYILIAKPHKRLSDVVAHL